MMDSTQASTRNLIGIYEKALPYSQSWQKRLEMAKNIGFDYVELSIDEDENRISRLDWSASQKQELQTIAINTGIPFLSMSLSGHRKYPLGSADPAIRQKSRDMLAKAIDLACTLGIRIVQLMGYWVFYETITPQSGEYFMEGLRWGVERAARKVDRAEVADFRKKFHGLIQSTF